MLIRDCFLLNSMRVKNVINQHFSSVSKENSLIFDEFIIPENSNVVNVGFSFVDKLTNKKHCISDYRIPSSIMLSGDDFLSDEYFLKFERFVMEDASSYSEHSNKEKNNIIVSESIIFIKKAWPHIVFLGAVLYVFSI